MEREDDLQFRIGSYVITFFSFRITKIENPVIGINSYLKNGNHVLLLDYDDISKKELIKDIVGLQHKFALGDAKIFRSSRKEFYEFTHNFPFIKKTIIKKWHVYFTQDERPYFEWMEAISYSKCDEQFKRWRLCRSCMTLRFSPKSSGYIPEPEFIVRSPFSKEETGFEDKILFAINQEKEVKNAKKDNSLQTSLEN